MAFFKSIPLSIWALTLAAFAIGTSEFVIMGLLLDISKSFHISVSQSGFLVSAYAMGVVIGGPIMTILTASFPRKATLIGLISIFVTGNIFCALAPSYELLLAGRLLTATCHGTFFGLASVAAAALMDNAHRTLGVALVLLGTTLANMLGVPIGTAEGFEWGWRSTFWSVSGLGLVAIIGLVLFLPKMHGNSKVTPLSEIQSLKNPLVLIPLVLSALVNGGLFVIFTYIEPLLVHVTKVPLSHVTYILLILGAGLPVGTLLGGKLGDKALLPSLSGLFPLLLCLVVLMHWTLTEEVLGVSVLFLWNLITFTIAPMLQVMVVNNAAHAPNLASTFNQSAFNFGNAVGAWSGGFALSHGLPYQNLPYLSFVYILTGMAFILLYRHLSRIKKQE